MINRIGVIYQDRNSFGFLDGLRQRLNCAAQLIAAPAAIGTSRQLTRKQAKQTWQYFQKKGVELVVRLTDADQQRWQEVRRSEEEVFPAEARSMYICGVAVNNTEDWLCLDTHHLAALLAIAPSELADVVHRTDRVKHALSRARRENVDEGLSDMVARIVRDAPSSVFRRWLRDDALQRFYSDCRLAATAADCGTPNELGEENG